MKISSIAANALLVLLFLGILVVPIASMGIMGFTEDSAVLSIQDTQYIEVVEASQSSPVNPFLSEPPVEGLGVDQD